MGHCFYGACPLFPSESAADVQLWIRLGWVREDTTQNIDELCV